MLPKIKVEFIVTGTQLTPDEITRLLGLSPSRTWQVGDSIQGTELRRKHNGWSLSVRNRENEIDFADCVNPLLEVLLPKSEQITHICGEFGLEAEFSFLVYLVDEAPIINFPEKIISSIAKINAAIDIDIVITDV